MDLRKCVVIVVCLISLSNLMTGGFGGRRRQWEMFSGIGVKSQELDEDTVKHLWINCMLDPSNMNIVLNREYISILREIISGSSDIDFKVRLLSETDLQKAIAHLSHDMDALLECIGKQDGDLRNKFAGYVESLHGGDTATRRHLADQASEVMAPASVSTPSLSPGSTPAPVPAPRFASFPGGERSSPATPASDPSSSSSPSLDKAFPPPTSEDILPTVGSPYDSKNFTSNAHGNSNNSIIITVILTAIGTWLIFTCVLCCYIKCYKIKFEPGGSQRDDRPLLALSLSDVSGASQKSYGIGSSINSNKFGSLSSKTDSNQPGCLLSFDISLAESQPAGALSGIPDTPVDTSTAQTNISTTISPPGPPPTPPPPPPVMPPPVRNVPPPPPAPAPARAPASAPRPPVPPPPRPGLRPPPPPKSAIPPRPPQASSSLKVKPPSPLGPSRTDDAASSQHYAEHADAGITRTKLKPFFWEKVLANPDDSMVWHQIKAGSFQFNEEMIETLFGYAADKGRADGRREMKKINPTPQFIQLLEPKKSQNLAISLKAMGVKLAEVCDALMEGNELPVELLQTLLRMPPTVDEELKLRLYSGEFSLLGPAEQFLKVLVDIPFAFKRMDALLFMASVSEDASGVKEAFRCLEVACTELRNSRLFRKLLEAVLKTGNRMNVGTFRGGADAFKLDTLLKLSDVKGTDGKTTLLHFVVQEIIRSEGVRAARTARESKSMSSLTISSLGSFDLTEDPVQETEEYYRSLGLKVVSDLSTELENVKKAATLDADALTSMVASLGHRLVKTKEFLNTDMKSLEEESRFHCSLKSFVEHAETDITLLLEEEKKIRLLVKSTTDYFHGNAGKDEGLRLFVIVRDFLGMVDKACKEVREVAAKLHKPTKSKDDPLRTSSSLNDHRQRLFPAIRDRRIGSMDSSSSDDD